MLSIIIYGHEYRAAVHRRPNPPDSRLTHNNILYISADGKQYKMSVPRPVAGRVEKAFKAAR